EQKDRVHELLHETTGANRARLVRAPIPASLCPSTRSRCFRSSSLPAFRSYSCGAEAPAGDKYQRANGPCEIDSHEPLEGGHSGDISDRAGWLDPPETA